MFISSEGYIYLFFLVLGELHEEVSVTPHAACLPEEAPL